MKTLHSIILAAVSLLLCLQGCHPAPDYQDDPYGNFDCLWQTVNDHYCFFEEKDIDWQAVGAAFRAKVSADTRWDQLYSICASMLYTLEDGHVNLTTPFATSYYRKWWTDYPQDFNLRTLQENYLNFQYLSTSGIMYAMLEDHVAYIYIPSFSSRIGRGNLDYVLALLSDSRGLIIDIRDNGGGLLTNIEVLVSRFIDRDYTGAYITHKLSPAHGDFSAPYPLVYKPAEEDRVKYTRPVVVLTNRSCFSAANSFAAVMKGLPQVVVAGARTGGGGGMPFTSELPNGWSVRFSACPMYDSAGRSIESGIDPTPGFEATSPAVELAEGKDAILDLAIDYVKSLPYDKPE